MYMIVKNDPINDEKRVCFNGFSVLIYTQIFSMQKGLLPIPDIL